MTKATIVARTENSFALSGVLNFDTVPALQRQGLNLFKSCQQPIRVCLAEVAYSDSSGLALLTEWVRGMQKINHDICFINMPQQMRAIADVTGMAALLPLENSERC